MEVKFKKLNEKATLPSYAKIGDAGMDLVSTGCSVSYMFVEYSTGLAVEIPEGHVGLLFPRSSVSNQDLILANCVGVIDSSYRGEIKLRFKINTTRAKKSEIGITSDPLKNYQSIIKSYLIGEKVGQLIILPIPKIEPKWSDELSSTERGEGGFGHTGK
jgi:dUTP pyrophosphatase